LRDARQRQAVAERAYASLAVALLEAVSPLGVLFAALTDDKARRTAANIAKLPEMVWRKADGL